jgi:site-specific recombinase XerD
MTEIANIPLGEKAYGVIEDLQGVLEDKKRRYPKVYESRPLAETYVIQKQRGWGQYQIRSVQDKFRKAMNQAGLPKELKFHCLRHAFATHILSNGGNLHGVSKIMGHSSPQVTSQLCDRTTALSFRETGDLV